MVFTAVDLDYAAVWFDCPRGSTYQGISSRDNAGLRRPMKGGTHGWKRGVDVAVYPTISLIYTIPSPAIRTNIVPMVGVHALKLLYANSAHHKQSIKNEFISVTESFCVISVTESFCGIINMYFCSVLYCCSKLQ